MNILLIDDDKDDQHLFCEALRMISPGITCEVAGNGKEGLTKLNDSKELPNLIFLDINMPVMNGQEVLEVIKSTPRLKNIAIAIYSTSKDPRDIKNLEAFGVKYITKPDRFEDLKKLLSEHIMSFEKKNNH